MYKIYTKNGCTPPGYIKKILLIMKITVIFLFAALMQVSAAGLAQRLTLVKKDATLKQIFDAVNKQTNYNFVWSADQLNINQPVNADFKDTPLLEVLDKCLSNTGMTYTIEDKTVVIRIKEETFIDKAKAYFAQVTISGKVQDETGAPLTGVTVKIKGSGNGTITDAKGAFSITVPDDNTIMAFTYIGYEPQEFRAKDLPAGSVIKMKASPTNLQEIVVSKGYYNVKQRENTGDLSVVSGKEIAEQPVTDLAAALEGRVPGLYVSVSGNALPGMASTVRLMGRNSISNGNDLLYVVDGVPFGFTTGPTGMIIGNTVAGGAIGLLNTLNPSDIESIEVLKDADATAIYGSRGANGVMLITTKKGKVGKTRFDFTISSGFSSPAKEMDLMNTQQYLQMRHQAFANDGKTPGAGDYDVNGTWDTTRYTNWQKVLLDNTSHFTNVNGTISGGNANTQFSLSGTYNKLDSYLPGNFYDQKGAAHFNLTHSSSDGKFHLDASFNYVNDNNILPGQDPKASILLQPDAPPLYDQFGNLNWANGTWSNPYAGLQQTSTMVTNNIIGNIRLSYDILSNLKFSTNIGGNFLQSQQKVITPSTMFNPATFTSNSRRSILGNNNINEWTIEPQLNYTKALGKGRLDAIIGATFLANSINSSTITGSNFTSDALLGSVSAAGSFSNPSYSTSQYHYSAAFARVGYAYDEKYILNLTGRRDGSSQFGPGNQFGNFGAVGAAWIFSKEKLIEKDLPFLSLGKLRASYGTTGNDQITPYQYLATFSPTSTYQNIAGLTPTRISNPYFGWELIKKLNMGIDLGFINDRILLSGAYYRNRSGNQLVGYPLPTTTGFTSVQYNLPAVVQNTGWEFTVNTVNLDGKDFKWTSSFNLTIPRNELVSYPGLASSTLVNTYAVGQPLSVQHLYHYTGIDPNTGLYTFQDVNNDGKITSPQDQLFSSALAQNYYGGFANNFSYKGFQLDIFFQFVKQTGTNYLSNFTIPGFFTAAGNQPTFIINDPALSKYSQNVPSPTSQAFLLYKASDAKITDASFIRLKNVSLSYQLPGKWQEKLHLQNTKIFIQGQNLLTFTKYQGIDPENQGYLPPMRTITMGLQFGL